MPLLTVRRFHGGRCLITYLKSLDGQHVTITTPVNLWRPRKRRKRRKEIGGIPWRPFRLNAKALRELRRQSLDDGDE